MRKIILLDMAGNFIKKQNITNLKNSISLKGLQSGVYMLHIVFSNNNSFSTKISVYGK